MAIDQTIDTTLMAQRYVATVHEMLAARKIFFRQQRGVAEFWLVTFPISVDIEMGFYGKSQLLYDQFPDTPIDFHVINPTHFSPYDLATILPEGVERIVIHAQPE